MAEDAANRTEEPTPKRREEARADGRIPQSVEITAATVLLAALLATWRTAATRHRRLRESMRRSLLAVTKLDLTPAQLGDVLHGMLHDVTTVVSPILLATAIAGFVATVAQIGSSSTASACCRTLEDLAGERLQRIFSTKGLFDLGKAIVKIALIGWLSWTLIRASEGTIIALSGRRRARCCRSRAARWRAWSAGRPASSSCSPPPTTPGSAASTTRACA
jgi:flagellar biosynthetic protein FlhB